MKKILAVSALLATTGCSTLVNGTSQEMTFEVPKDQVCLVNTAEKTIASVQTNSNTLKVERNKNPLTLHCPTYTKHYKPSVTAAGWTSITFVDFGMVDYATGAIWEYVEDDSEK